MKKLNTLNVVTTAMLCSFAVVMSSALHHLMPDIGKALSPMHLPVFLAGILCGNWMGLICGACAPLLSFLASGRPIFPTGLFPMMFELATYGFLTGTMRNLFVKNPKTHKLASVLALAIAMIAGRVVNGIVGGMVMAMGGAPLWTSILTQFTLSFATTWLGIIVQLILVPTILFALQKGGILINYLTDTYQPPNADQQSSGDNQQVDVPLVDGTEDQTTN